MHRVHVSRTVRPIPVTYVIPLHIDDSPVFPRGLAKVTCGLKKHVYATLTTIPIYSYLYIQ